MPAHRGTYTFLNQGGKGPGCFPFAHILLDLNDLRHHLSIARENNQQDDDYHSSCMIDVGLGVIYLRNGNFRFWFGPERCLHSA